MGTFGERKRKRERQFWDIIHGLPIIHGKVIERERKKRRREGEREREREREKERDRERQRKRVK